MEINEISINAMGGTELMLSRLHNSLPKDLLENFQIIPSRVRELNPDKIRIYWAHDLHNDPETNHLSNNGWMNFHKIVFVSNWQMQHYIEKYNIPWEHCMVIQNAIYPIDMTLSDKDNDVIKLIYHTTPHRGLGILIPVFEKLKKKHNIELDVFSSYKIYGQDKRDEQYKDLFDKCKNTKGVNYFGSVSNEEIRQHLKKSHIFAYPSMWQETSCLALIEAMSAGNICVHPNLGALYETSSNWTEMYQWSESTTNHANLFYNVMDNVISNFDVSSDVYRNKIFTQKKYIDIFHNWESRSIQWEEVLKSLIDLPREIPSKRFIYRTV